MYILTNEKPPHSLRYFVYELCKKHEYLTIGYILKTFDLGFLCDEERTKPLLDENLKGFKKVHKDIYLDNLHEAYYSIAYNQILRALDFLEENNYISLDKVPMISYGKGTTPEEIKHIEWFKNFKGQVLTIWNEQNKYQITDKKSFDLPVFFSLGMKIQDATNKITYTTALTINTIWKPNPDIAEVAITAIQATAISACDTALKVSAIPNTLPWSFSDTRFLSILSLAHQNVPTLNIPNST